MKIKYKIINHLKIFLRISFIYLDLFKFFFYSIYLKHLLKKKVILTYDNNFAPETFGDFLHFCFLVRYFKKKKIFLKFYLLIKKLLKRKKIFLNLNKIFVFNKLES